MSTLAFRVQDQHLATEKQYASFPRQTTRSRNHNAGMAELVDAPDLGFSTIHEIA